ncbi:CD99 antigen-like isoform X2 [Canis lupus baileyi]|uniref:CD99 antigen isoform X2 n=1 Tax=Canis lupus dingo TaxID=286419 RepID=UPI0020C27C80|nr:CD99 antigen isoform X2 [Canis lupus dingo]
MARRAAVALLLLGLLGTLRPARGQDFDLSDALGDNDKKPTAPPKKPSPDDDGFSLEDALGGGGNNDPVPPNPPKPKPNPNPNQPGSSGGFSDSDLVDGASDGESTGMSLGSPHSHGPRLHGWVPRPWMGFFPRAVRIPEAPRTYWVSCSLPWDGCSDSGAEPLCQVNGNKSDDYV